MHARNGSDRRVSRTRATLLASFNRLLLANGYENLSVRALAADANVGRSTFYEHFESKENLLEHSVASVLAVIATATAKKTPNDALLELLRHVQAHSVLTCALLRGSTRAILLRTLALKLERQLAALARTSLTPPIAPLAFVAQTLAHAQLGAIDAWLSADVRCDARVATRALVATSRAGVVAMFESGA